MAIAVLFQFLFVNGNNLPLLFLRLKQRLEMHHGTEPCEIDFSAVKFPGRQRTQGGVLCHKIGNFVGRDKQRKGNRLRF